MKRYIKADSDISENAIADEYVAKYIELFADNGFEMKETPAYGSSRVLIPVSVDGDSSVAYKGRPLYDGYTMRFSDFWAISDGYWHWTSLEKLTPIQSDVESKMIEDVAEWIDQWSYVYDKLVRFVDEMHAIEPQLPSIAKEFKDSYSQEFPDLELDISIEIWYPADEHNMYPTLYDGDKEPNLLVSGIAAGREFRESYSWSTWKSGKGADDLAKKLSRIYKSAGRGAKSGNAEIVAILQEHGIDTTRSKYELVAERYERFSSGKKYKKTFSCPGDYLAYFGMLLHRTPNYNNLTEYFGDVTEFEEVVERHPTLNDIADYACDRNGDGDDYIISLTNLNTGAVLYTSEDVDEYDESDEDDWD